MIKQSIIFFIVLFACVTFYLLFDIFIFKNGDVVKWGSQLGAFEIGLFFSLFFVLSNMVGHILFLFLISIFRKENLSDVRRTISTFSAIGCFVFMTIFSNWFYLPDWIQIGIINDVISQMISWAIVAFFVSLIVLIALSFIRRYQLKSGT